LDERREVFVRYRAREEWDAGCMSDDEEEDDEWKEDEESYVTLEAE
jgi:hypothetical protein